MQLDVVSLAQRFLRVLVPRIRLTFKLCMFVLQASESDLLHHVWKEGRAGAGLFIDRQQPPHRSELNLFNVTGAVTAQFPVVGQGEIDGWLHARLSEPPAVAGG